MALLHTHDASCCATRTPLTAPQADAIAMQLKAVADPMRLRILSLIAAQGCEAVCACDLVDALELSQPTVSHHLKKLVDAGLLSREQRGKWAHYSIVTEAFQGVRDALSFD